MTYHSNFRGLTPAAPLKLDPDLHVVALPLNFRGLTPAAPLKQFKAVVDVDKGNDFRGLTPAAPLKHHQFQERHSTQWISAG